MSHLIVDLIFIARHNNIKFVKKIMLNVIFNFTCLTYTWLEQPKIMPCKDENAIIFNNI